MRDGIGTIRMEATGLRLRDGVNTWIVVRNTIVPLRVVPRERTCCPRTRQSACCAGARRNAADCPPSTSGSRRSHGSGGLEPGGQLCWMHAGWRTVGQHRYPEGAWPSRDSEAQAPGSGRAAWDASIESGADYYRLVVHGLERCSRVPRHAQARSRSTGSRARLLFSRARAPGAHVTGSSLPALVALAMSTSDAAAGHRVSPDQRGCDRRGVSATSRSTSSLPACRCRTWQMSGPRCAAPPQCWPDRTLRPLSAASATHSLSRVGRDAAVASSPSSSIAISRPARRSATGRCHACATAGRRRAGATRFRTGRAC